VRVMVPGVSIDRAQLAGGPAVMKIEVTGTYQANWQGPGVVLIDGLALSNGGELQMGAGKHAVEASGFIMGCEITLKRRE